VPVAQPRIRQRGTAQPKIGQKTSGRVKAGDQGCRAGVRVPVKVHQCDARQSQQAAGGCIVNAVGAFPRPAQQHGNDSKYGHERHQRAAAGSRKYDFEKALSSSSPLLPAGLQRNGSRPDSQRPGTAMPRRARRVNGT